MRSIVQICVAAIVCQALAISVQAQVVRASQRYQLVVPEQLRVSVQEPLFTRNESGMEIRQAVEIQAQPSEGLILQVALDNETPRRIHQVSTTDSLSQHHLSLEPGVVHWFQFPELRQSVAAAQSNEIICPELASTPVAARTTLSLELRFQIQQQPGRGTETVIATITGSP